MRKYQLILLALAFLAVPLASAQECDPVETHKLLAGDGVAKDLFGSSIAISGTTTIVGAIGGGDNGGGSGSAYLFDSTTGKQLFKLLPGDGAQFDAFGISVAISASTAIVGAYRDDENGLDSGSAYLFDITTGRQIAKLLPDDGVADDRFGFSVAISGAIAIVGAQFDDDNGTNSGSAYLFDSTTGAQIAKLVPSDGAEGDFFGVSVAISGVIAIVGAWGDDDNGTNSGSAYLFDATTGKQIAKLLPSDGAIKDFFGGSVGISGETAIVGAWGNDDNRSDSGSAYLFETATGQQTAKLLPSDGAWEDQFGWSVGISDSTAIVGSHFDDDNGSWSGSAYLFDSSTGQQIFKLLPGDGAVNDLFGESVAINATTAIIGALWDDDACPGDPFCKSGSAYVFELTCAIVQLTVDATCPDGGPIEVSWSNATPDRDAALVFALDRGGVLVPAGFPCQGTLLGLGSSQIQLARLVRSDQNGAGRLNGFAGNGACGGYLQLLDLTTCEVSNVALIE